MKMFRLGILLGVLAALGSGCGPQPPVRKMHYDVHLEVDANTHTLNVVSSFYAVAGDTAVDSLLLHLNRELEVTEVGGTNVQKYHVAFDSTLGLNTLTVLLNPRLQPGQWTQVEISYHGGLGLHPGEIPPFGKNWVVLDREATWFPMNEAYEPYTFSLAVYCEPRWQVRSFGDTGRRAGRWLFAQATPVRDIVVVAAPTLRSVVEKSGKDRAFVHYVSLGQDAASSIADSLLAKMVAKRGRDGYTGYATTTFFQSPVHERTTEHGYGWVLAGGLDSTDWREVLEKDMHLDHVVQVDTSINPELRDW